MGQQMAEKFAPQEKKPKISKIPGAIFEISVFLLRSSFYCWDTFFELSAFEQCASHVSATIILGDIGGQNFKKGVLMPL